MIQDLVERRVTVSIVGDVWQPNLTRKAGVREIATSIDYPDLRKLIKGYERRHGQCSSFTIEVVK